MLIHFDAVRIDRGEAWRWRAWTLPELKAVFARQDAAMGPHTWRTVCLSNHDNPRLVSHFGDPEEPWRIPSAKLLATLLMTQKGTPFVYQGDEIGMTNFPFTDIDQFDDIEVRNAWMAEVATNLVHEDVFLEHMNRTSRDHARTPMQWDGGPNAGFTIGAPWFAPNPNAGWLNAAGQSGPGSIYDHYARLIALRRTHPPLVYGDYVDLAPDHPELFAYRRTIDGAGALVLLNFSRETIAFEPPAGHAPGRHADRQPRTDARRRPRAARLGGAGASHLSARPGSPHRVTAAKEAHGRVRAGRAKPPASTASSRRSPLWITLPSELFCLHNSRVTAVPLRDVGTGRA